MFGLLSLPSYQFGQRIAGKWMMYAL